VTLAGIAPDASASWLLGTWSILRAESPIEIQPGTEMQFAENGHLEYAVPTGEGMIRVSLRWALNGSMLRTTFDDGSNEVEVNASLGDGDVLVLDFGGPRAWYVRVQ
jgi:hypothetical protein